MPLRGIFFSRLSNLIEGHGGATVGLVDDILAMLNEGRIPEAPVSGHGGPREILATCTIFAELSASRQLTPGERGALIDGAPCAAALLADAALAGKRWIALVQKALTLRAGRTPYAGG